MDTQMRKLFSNLERIPTASTNTPISRPQANYTLYTDALKYTYAGMLTQDSNGTDHPITYVSGLFRGSQLNWATLTKEAYAIYMSVKKLSFLHRHSQNNS